ncbi:hypothetical protein CDA63_05785 [Hymenobacter amundsenii]|uniref:Uncharacterized protein n=1 Tax=Hymenobacter amundsenii TaxID=2006685 RepID=A0A246FMI9_9BACT|nr:hypothetical protein [Hymenobacter amundsenii]OWP63976.1 hypothetical protein CDA63_05785 [Hymenobacter amundsenii]
MPKTIDYPRTSYQSAWEVAEVVDDTGGKCAIETAARKLNRKVSGSFKAIIGSAVKFGLLTSKRELLTTTNLFRRIKNAYDKQEERIYHREAFLHPPLFTQICRKFRNRELPVHMFDVMLVREFGVEEINTQNVSKAFIEGARMAGILNEQNIIADIDQLSAQQQPRRELASTEMPLNHFQKNTSATDTDQLSTTPPSAAATGISSIPRVVPGARTTDAVSSLFGLDTHDLDNESAPIRTTPEYSHTPIAQPPVRPATAAAVGPTASTAPVANASPVPPDNNPGNPNPVPAEVTPSAFTIHLHGPGLDTHLTIEHVDDLDLVQALLNKIRRQLA